MKRKISIVVISLLLIISLFLVVGAKATHVEDRVDRETNSDKEFTPQLSWEFGETRVYYDYGNVMDDTLTSGVYQIEVHGASGSDAPSSDHQGNGGSGGYIRGNIKVESESNLKMYIGESGGIPNGGWGRSDGGNGGYDSSSYGETRGGGGGGSTEILLDGSFLVSADGGGGGGSSDYDGWIMWNAAGGGGGGRGGSGGTTDNDGDGSNAEGSGYGGDGGDASATSGGQGRYADNGGAGGQSSSHLFDEISSSTGGSNYNNGRVEITDITRTLDISIEGQGNTDPSIGTNHYADADEIEIKATPDEGMTFKEWSGDVGTIEDTTEKETNITMDDDYEITAVFEEAEETFIEITPYESTIVAGNTEDYTSIVYDQYDYEMHDVTEETTWTIDDNAGGSWSQTDGIYISENNGVWNVECEYNGMTDTASLTVEIGEVDHVEISPSSDFTLDAGQTEKFTAVAYDSEENLITRDVTDFTWNNIYEVDEEENLAIFYKEKDGDHGVTAKYEDITSATTTVKVEPVSFDYITIYPEMDQWTEAGQSIELTAGAYDEFHNLITKDVTDFSWQNIHELDENNNFAVFYKEDVGKYEVTAEFKGVSSSVRNVKVEPTDVDNVVISPSDDLNLEVGVEQEFTAEAYDKFGNLITDNATDFTWDNITQENITDDSAVFYEVDVGDYQVTAIYYGDYQDSVTVRVEEEPTSFLSDYWWLIVLLVITTVIATGILLLWKNRTSPIQQPIKQHPPPKQKVSQGKTLKDKLEGLHEMKNKGLISEEEFETKKEDILENY